MRALMLMVLVAYAVIVELIARSLIEWFPTYLTFEAYHWPATLTWLAPAVFLAAGLSILLLDGHARLASRGRIGGSIPSPAAEGERHGGWRHASERGAAIMRVTTLLFLAMIVELGSWYALTEDLRRPVQAFVLTISDVGSSVILLVAAAWAVVELCRFLMPRGMTVTGSGSGRSSSTDGATPGAGPSLLHRWWMRSDERASGAAPIGPLNRPGRGR